MRDFPREKRPAGPAVPEEGAAVAGRSGGDVPSETPSAPSGAPLETAASQQIWSIDQFEATTAAELDTEKAFYAALGEAWRSGDNVRAFDLVTNALGDHPTRYELRLLRAGVTLSGVGAGTLPLRVLGGESGESVDVSVGTLLFVVAEFQRGVPEEPPALVPWTGLYHPHVLHRLLGSYVSLWSHGLRPLLRNRALIAGEPGVFEDFEPESPSLVESVLIAQLRAARGEVARARDALAIRVEEQVATEYVPRWRVLVRALEAGLDALALVSARDARSVLVAWEKAVTELIPEARGTLLILPLAALQRLEERRQGETRESRVAIPEAESIRRVLVKAAGEGPSAPSGENARADHLEMVESFLAAALRLRDFRADSLVRLRSGDRTGVLSDGLARQAGLVFEENGRRRVWFFSAGEGLDSPDADRSGWTIPCGDEAWVWVE